MVRVKLQPISAVNCGCNTAKKGIQDPSTKAKPLVSQFRIPKLYFHPYPITLFPPIHMYKTQNTTSSSGN